MSGYLDRHYAKNRVPTFRGRKIIPFSDWSRMSTRNRDILLDYLPDRAVPFAESDVQRLVGRWEWLVDYRGLMIQKNDRDFISWNSRGLGAWTWERIRLVVEVYGDVREALAEERRRGRNRECIICQFPDIVDAHMTEFGDGLYEAVCFCREHTSAPENLWDPGGRRFKEEEYRIENRLCHECGSPNVVLRESWVSAPSKYHCPDEVISRGILSDPVYAERVRRGEIDWVRFTDDEP